jgi:hypothetical protein
MMNNFSWDLFVMNQNTNMAGGWELKKIMNCFLDTTHEPLYLWTHPQVLFE